MIVTDFRSPRSLDFANVRKAMLLHDSGMSWWKVAQRVVSLSGHRPGVRTLRRHAAALRTTGRCKTYKFHKCGRKPWKVTRQMENFVVRRVCALRRCCICTATTLQREVVAEFGTQLDVSTIRKVLRKKGYRWLPRSQKPRLSAALMAERARWAAAVLRLSNAALREKLSLSLDGVVLSLPPEDKVDRLNWGLHGDSHMWRKPGEAAQPELAGRDDYPGQVKIDRCVPMWGGISEGGMAIVTVHPNKKLSTAEWATAVRGGKLTRAISGLGPVRPNGPWVVLCDNESFLSSTKCGLPTAYRRAKIRLWHVPPKSPDLNPVEKYWGWLRKELRRMDLAALRAGQRALDKQAYIRRVRALCATQRAQRVAKAYARSFRSVCQEVVHKNGARSRS